MNVSFNGESTNSLIFFPSSSSPLTCAVVHHPCRPTTAFLCRSVVAHLSALSLSPHPAAAHLPTPARIWLPLVLTRGPNVAPFLALPLVHTNIAAHLPHCHTS
jgi:hypothetical protein